jgi:hypothetical protein
MARLVWTDYGARVETGTQTIWTDYGALQETVSEAAAATVRAWSGSAWTTRFPKVWSGSAWTAKPARVWSGSAWVP